MKHVRNILAVATLAAVVAAVLAYMEIPERPGSWLEELNAPEYIVRKLDDDYAKASAIVVHWKARGDQDKQEQP